MLVWRHYSVGAECRLPIRHSLSITMAANFQSFSTLPASSSSLILSVITYTNNTKYFYYLDIIFTNAGPHLNLLEDEAELPVHGVGGHRLLLGHGWLGVRDAGVVRVDHHRPDNAQWWQHLPHFTLDCLSAVCTTFILLGSSRVTKQRKKFIFRNLIRCLWCYFTKWWRKWANLGTQFIV